MTLGDWLVQNLSGVFQGVIITFFGILANRFLRRVSASQARTEETVAKLSNLDRVSLTSHDAVLEQWQRDVALRVDGLAEGKSDTLAWQAQFDRRLAAVEQFAEALDDFAHGRGDVPTYTTPIPALQEEPA